MSSSFGNIIKRSYSSVIEWAPKPLKKPSVYADFDELLSLARASESIKYNLLCMEYFLSPRGGLREAIKMSISIVILFFLLWLPCMIGITLIAAFVLKLELLTFSVFKTVLYAFLATIISLILYALILNLPKMLKHIKARSK